MHVRVGVCLYKFEHTDPIHTSLCGSFPYLSSSLCRLHMVAYQRSQVNGWVVVGDMVNILNNVKCGLATGMGVYTHTYM